MRKFNYIFLVLGLLTLLAKPTFAQDPGNADAKQKVEAIDGFTDKYKEANFIDGFFESGKIKVVLVGVGFVLAILIFYLVRLERKLNKLEKES